MSTWHRVEASCGTAYTRNPPPRAWSRDGASVADMLNLTDADLRRCVAYHEAGHVVVGHRAGIPIMSATISADSDGGQTDVGDVRVAVGLDLWAAFLAAGEVALTRWLQRVGLLTPARAWAVEMGAIEDRRNLEEAVGGATTPMLVGYGSNASDHVISYADVCEAARRRMWMRWHEVEAVAEQLYRSGSLDGDQLGQLIDAADAKAGAR